MGGGSSGKDVSGTRRSRNGLLRFALISAGWALNSQSRNKMPTELTVHSPVKLDRLRIPNEDILPPEKPVLLRLARYNRYISLQWGQCTATGCRRMWMRTSATKKVSAMGRQITEHDVPPLFNTFLASKTLPPTPRFAPICTLPVLPVARGPPKRKPKLHHQNGLVQGGRYCGKEQWYGRKSAIKSLGYD